MKFPLSWLKEHLDTDASLDEIVHRMTLIGLEVDQVIDRAKALQGFVCARVLEAEKHPDADKLRVCTVDTGAETLQVVCGAPNARTGMMGVFAGVNSYIPGSGLTLKKTKIRGVESNGMLLSESEMGLGDDHAGIVELPEDAPLGAAASQVMGLDDAIIDIEITPNRGDCLGVRGIARDLAATGLGALKPLDVSPVPGSFESPLKVNLDFDADSADACPYFVGRYVRGVTNGESPKWLKDKLLAVGLRPISALVDITNLLTIGLCRPLHVFDAGKLKGDLHVRLSSPGEMLQALDDKIYELDGEMTVIADEAEAQALGGVIGGERSGCSAETTDVFIEAAYFDPLRTARTGRKLNLISDARFRFERGVDPAFLVDGMEIATRLVLDLCGGQASEPVIAGAEPDWRRNIPFRPDRIKGLCGVDIPWDEAKRILTVLGFTLEKDGGAYQVGVPSWRGDIVGEADVVEEVVRIHGYDRIPTVPLEPVSALPQPALSVGQRRRSTARRLLAGRGLVEAVTLSFMSSPQTDLFGGVADSVRLVNPISSDLDVMRPSILPNLIAACGRNADRGIADAALFEVGPQYSGDGPEDQAMAASGVRSGRSGHRNWTAPPRPVDAFDAKADALAVLEALGVNTANAQVTPQAPAWYHPGRSGVISLGPKMVLAAFGEVHPGVLAKMNVKGPHAAFEVYLDNLPKPKAKKSAARPHLKLSSLQPVQRDFAFVIDEDVSAADLVRAAREGEKDLIAKVRVFDLFSGGNLGEGKKSLAINVTLQPLDKTLTDMEIDAIAKQIVTAVEDATGGVLRG